MKIKLWPYMWFILGTVLLVFANGRWIIPLAAWLAPLCMLRFTRASKAVQGLPLSLMAYVVAFIIVLRGAVPLDGVFFYCLIAGSFGFIFWLPYLVDRLIAPRVKGFLATLVFPLAWTTVEFVNALINPFPTWGSLAYTQYGNLPLMQIVSVTGMWGVVFLVSWCASVVNWAWEQEFEWSHIRKGVGIYGAMLIMVLLFGGLRLAFFAPNADTVKVASIITTPAIKPMWLEAVLSISPPVETCQQLLDNYLDRSRQQARAGAKIIIWDESSLIVPAGAETMVIERGREFARQEQVYLLLTTLTQTKPGIEEFENTASWIEPDGTVAWRYLKSQIVPGDTQLAGDGRIRTRETPYGRIAAAICFDMDQPRFIRQAGRAGADIMFAPADDWQAIDPVHTQMASFRAIENGFSLVKPTSEGLSAAYDYQGRVLAATDYFTSDDDDGVMIAHLPTQGVRTLYALIGDTFAWLCIAGFTLILGVAFWPKK